MSEEKKYLYGWEEIKACLPHRYPFIFIDRVISVERPKGLEQNRVLDSKVHSMKCVTGNEQFLQGHFPDFAVVPGVILIEMMAQTSIFVTPLEVFKKHKTKVFLSKIIECKFRSMVRPGDVLDIFCHVVSEKGKFYTAKTSIKEHFSQKNVCEARMMAYISESK